MTRLRAFGGAGGASLAAIALLLSPALATGGGNERRSVSLSPSMARSVGTFTPALSDPRLTAVLQRRRATGGADIRFTPAAEPGERNRDVRVAIRARAKTPAEAERSVVETSSASAVTPVTPSSYNLGASVGWRRFALTGDVSRREGGATPGARELAEVGMSYRANRRLTGQVEVAAERAEGVQRIVGDDEAYSLDVGGSYSIARNLDVTGGVKYRIANDRLDPLARDQRHDSQAVYIGTAFRF